MTSVDHWNDVNREQAAAPGEVRRWRAFWLLAVAFLMTVVDLAIVNVALPTIGREPHFPQSDLQWVVTAYALAFGGFLLLGGRAADLLGRRRRAAARLRVPHPCRAKEHVMSLSYRLQPQLRLIEAGLIQSDPKLAGMLGVFGRLSAGQGMPAWERVPSRQDRIRQAAALLVEAVNIVAAAISLLLSAVLALAGAAISRRSPRLPAPGPGRTRRGRPDRLGGSGR